MFQSFVSGELIRTISKVIYNDLAAHDGQLYAADMNSPSIHVYDCRTWQRLRSISTPCSDSKYDGDLYDHTICVNSTGIRLSCWDCNMIYVLDAHGILKQTHGPRITIIPSSNAASEHSMENSELTDPLICQEDDDGEVLLAEFSNNRILILTAEGHWRQVKLNCELQGPCSAVWWKCAFYVSTYDDRKLTMFH